MLTCSVMAWGAFMAANTLHATTAETHLVSTLLLVRELCPLRVTKVICTYDSGELCPFIVSALAQGISYFMIVYSLGGLSNPTNHILGRRY